jgi:hypothetical protein
MSSKITHLKYKEIDFKKYNDCIDNAVNTRVYAYSWYLDIVCNKDWEVLILDDYQTVMPLPFKRIKKKFLKRMVVQPLFCQQLGVFSVTELSLDRLELFLNKLANFKVSTLSFNAENLGFLKEDNNFKESANFELNLNKDHSFLYKNFSKGLKLNIKKGIKNDLKVKKGIAFLEYKKMKINNSFHKIKEKDFLLMNLLTQKIMKKNLGNFYGVYKDEKLISLSFLIESNDRIIYLLSSTNELGKKYGATPYLLNYIMDKNCNKNIIFDFEGSNILGLAKFFKSFGSNNNPYFVFNKN